MSIASDYLVWYVASHLGLTCNSSRGRLAYVLSNLAKGIGNEDPVGRELDMTNEELAHAANLTEFTVSRLLSEWQCRGAIKEEKRRGLHSLARKALLLLCLTFQRASVFHLAGIVSLFSLL